MTFQKGNKEYLKRKPMTEEQRRKASENNSGANNPCFNKPRPQSVKDAISIALTGRSKDPEVVAKIAASNTGKKRTEEQNKENGERMTLFYVEHPEAREAARDKALAQWADPETRAKCAEANRIAAQDPAKRAKISQIVTQLWQDEEYSMMMSNSHKGQTAWNKDIPMSEETRTKLKASLVGLQCGEKNGFYGRHHTEESNEKNRVKHQQLWQDEEYSRKQCISRSIKPNNPESLIKLITEEYWQGWKYTGDYSCWINGKNPDFVNEELKLIIEFYGDYWHRGDDPTDRMEIFSQAGYDTLVIWEWELQDMDKVIWKIKMFVEGQLLNVA